MGVKNGYRNIEKGDFQMPEQNDRFKTGGMKQLLLTFQDKKAKPKQMDKKSHIGRRFP